MAFSLVSTIEIPGRPEDVWRVLTDLAGHPEWNSALRIEGALEKGARLKVTPTKPDGADDMAFRPVVLAADEPRELRWIGRLLVRGVFDGEHYFRIEPLDDNRVRFTQGENFNGLLVPFLKAKLARDTKDMFERFNAALAARVAEVADR